LQALITPLDLGLREDSRRLHAIPGHAFALRMDTVFLRATVLMIGPAIGVYLMRRRLGIFKF
jgi:hypothetical protein